MKYKLFHGNSPYLSLQAVHVEIKNFTDPDISVEIVNADTQKPQELIDKIGSQNLFVQKRLFFVKRLLKNKDKDKIVEHILKHLLTETPDIFLFWEDQKVRSTTKYFKFFKQNNSLDEYTQLNKRTFFSWLKIELANRNMTADVNTQRILAENTNYDPERCSNELKKLQLKGTSNISIADLEEYSTNTLEQDIWKLIDSINTKNSALGLEILENLKTQNNDPNYILSMIARNLKLITLTKHLITQGKDFKEIASLLKVPPFTLPSLINIAKQYDSKKIVSLYCKLSNLDFQIKTGKIDGHLGLTLICPYL